MKSQRINFPSEIHLVSLNYFNCELVEVISFWSECQKTKKRERANEIAFSLSCLFLDSSVLCSIKNTSKIKMLVCSECMQLLRMSNS